MTPIIITGHGKFATSMKETIKYIMGEQQNIYFVDFDNGMGNKELEEKLCDILSKLDSDEVLFLTDIAGGTPFSTAVLLSENNPKYRIYSGCNMPMIISAIELAEEDDIVSIDRDILCYAKEGIVLFESKKEEIDIIIEEDGI